MHGGRFDRIFVYPMPQPQRSAPGAGRPLQPASVTRSVARKTVEKISWSPIPLPRSTRCGRTLSAPDRPAGKLSVRRRRRCRIVTISSVVVRYVVRSVVCLLQFVADVQSSSTLKRNFSRV